MCFRSKRKKFKSNIITKYFRSAYTSALYNVPIKTDFLEAWHCTLNKRPNNPYPSCVNFIGFVQNEEECYD